MNEFLNEVRVLMREKGYNAENIKRVIDSLNNFFNYISRNSLQNEFIDNFDSFKSNIFRRINGQKNVTNIESVAVFNGTSFASTFVKHCIEKRVYDILDGFLKSAESYYNMACGNSSMDYAKLQVQLCNDGIDSSKLIKLTAPTTIMAFATELSLKTLYSMKNYEAVVRNCYSMVTVCEDGVYPNEGLLNDRVKLIEMVSGDWKNISISSKAQDTMNDVRDSYTQDKPVNLMENDAFGNVKVNGHTLYKVFDRLPEEYKSMIKYQVATAFARGDKKTLDEKVVSAIDYFLMISSLDTTLGNMDSTKQMIINSNNFDRMRYLIDQLGSEELLFTMSYASASYIVARSEVEGIIFSDIKNSDYTSKGLAYSEKLEELITTDESKKFLLDYICTDRQLLKACKGLKAKDLYVLIDMFSLDEINWMKESCDKEESCSFKEMLYFCIFFKKHVNSYEFIYDNEKYKNINRLFYTIKTTNNLAMLGSQIAQWFAEINIYSLSQDEFEALKIFDNEFIFNSLNYKDKVLYKRCNDKGVPFKIYYTSSAYTSVISKYMTNPKRKGEDLEEYIGYSVNRNFNRLLVINDEQFNKLSSNTELFNYLVDAFGSAENIPNFLIALPLSDIEVILEHCKKHNVSIKDWASTFLGESCLFCKATHMVRAIANAHNTYDVRLGSLFTRDNDKTTDDFFGEETFNASSESLTFGLCRNKNMGNLTDLMVKDIYSSDTITIDVPKPTDKDMVDYLLDNGIDYMDALYIPKNCTTNKIEFLMYFAQQKAIPKELLASIIAGKISLDSVVAKSEFFVNNGIRLDDIPLYYYSRNDIDIDTFEKLFGILDGIYNKEHIPNTLLIKETEKVSELLAKLRESKINIYDFMSYLPSYSPMLFTNTYLYIYAYGVVKDVSINSGMEIKDFDAVVADYSRLKYLWELYQNDPVLLKASLYKNLEDILYIRKICDESNKEFCPELLYFDIDFLNTNFELAYMCISMYRMTKRELEYNDAKAFMESNMLNMMSLNSEMFSRKVA